MAEILQQTVFYPLHKDAGAKLVPFTGYEMPVNYPPGIIKEHLHTREKAGLFDVSHMGQIQITGDAASAQLETLIPVDIASLQLGQQKYGMFTNDRGGILDDLMISRITENEFLLVVNSACKDNDFNHIQDKIGNYLHIEMLSDKSLLALQGPAAKDVLARLGNDLTDMPFMHVRELELKGIPCLCSRSGYTGEDGFEISMESSDAEAIARLLLSDDDVQWVGLGARDSLRLEAGLCLYGHDINTETTPIEANLLWAISKSRCPDGERAGGFPGADVILPQIPKNVSRLLVGLNTEGCAPIREGAIIESIEGKQVGNITSGGFSPSLRKPICMGYVDLDYSEEHTGLNAVVRDKRLPVSVTKLPLMPRRYYRG